MVWPNDLFQDLLKPIHHGFRDNLVTDVTQANRFKILRTIGVLNLGIRVMLVSLCYSNHQGEFLS